MSAERAPEATQLGSDLSPRKGAAYRSGRGRGGGAGQGHDLLDGQPQLQPVQRVADADLTLDLRVRQGGHDGAALHVGSASSHVPGWHPNPELGTGDPRRGVRCGCRGTDRPARGAGRAGPGRGAHAPPARRQQ